MTGWANDSEAQKLLSTLLEVGCDPHHCHVLIESRRGDTEDESSFASRIREKDAAASGGTLAPTTASISISAL